MSLDVRAVAADQWDVVGWLWQAFRNDLAPMVGSYPRPDGRYKHAALAGLPDPGTAGYLLWTPHPELAEDVPVGLALIGGLVEARRTVAAFWTAPVLRRSGVGTAFALDVLARHPGPWSIAFQHDNPGAGAFWRRVAEQAFGPVGTAWVEEQRAVPGKPHVPPDHWIETT